MAEAALKAEVEETQDLTDGFSLVIDAMKLSGLLDRLGCSCSEAQLSAASEGASAR